VAVRAYLATACALAALWILTACAGLIGIDEPHVVATEAGDLDSAGGQVDAGRDDASDARPANTGDASVDAGDGAEASAQASPSCLSQGPGRNDCGPHADESCCASPLVEGGTFLRSYDPDAGADASQEDPATVSSFRLDRFEITVGRFRPFVDRLDAGWLPAEGSGKHSHLNGGHGVNAGSEPGWSSSWNMYLASTPGDLSCDPTSQTWGVDDNLPLSCLNWYEAYAFCIWDGGFLPTEAEWYYAAAGGADQRTYPWSNPAMSPAIGCADANYSGCPTMTVWKGGYASPAGDGRWGQADLAGNLQEWVLDSLQVSYPNPCDDCAFISSSAGALRMNRGGSFSDTTTSLLASSRSYDTPVYGYALGARCARSP
jgi:formylglycine-generating enzyme required for sulfatase activity